MTAHLKDDDDRRAYLRRDEDVTGKTATWVRWSVGALITVAGIMGALWANNERDKNILDRRLVAAEAKMEMYSSERLAMDRQIVDKLEMLTTQHAQITALFQRLLDQDLVRAPRDRDNPTPAFPRYKAP